MKEKRSRILIFFFAALVLCTIAATYYNTIVLKNFEIINDLEEEG